MNNSHAFIEPVLGKNLKGTCIGTVILLHDEKATRLDRFHWFSVARNMFSRRSSEGFYLKKPNQLHRNP